MRKPLRVGERKLVLSKETLRQLDGEALQLIASGSGSGVELGEGGGGGGGGNGGNRSTLGACPPGLSPRCHTQWTKVVI